MNDFNQTNLSNQPDLPNFTISNISKRPQSEDLLRKNSRLQKQMKKLDPIDPNRSIANEEFESRPALTERKINHNCMNPNSTSYEIDKNGFTLRHDLNDIGVCSFKINQRQDLSRTKSMVNQDLKNKDNIFKSRE